MFIGYSVFICSYFVTLEIMIRISYIATIICVTCVTCVFAKDFYDTKYDDVNVSEILANVKLREQYYKCFMNQGPCVTADAKFFRDIIGEAYYTNCKKCNDKQKVMLEQSVKFYRENEPDKWKAFEEKTKKDFEKTT